MSPVPPHGYCLSGINPLNPTQNPTPEDDNSTLTMLCLKSLSSQQSQDKGKGILIEPVKKKDQILLDEETALNLQAEFDEEERLAREKAEKEQEANIALIETWDD
ncbi:hypothetical protein Tco_0465346 [Tanacetum coccineum]